MRGVRFSRGRGGAGARRVLALGSILIVPFLLYHAWQWLLAPDTYFDIYLLGGSTAKGTPYDPTIDLGKLIGYYFEGRIAGKPVRVINLAEGGGSAAVAYERSGEIRRGADLVLLYSGNNEFLRFNFRLDKDRDLSRNPRSVFDVPLVSTEEKNEILRQYRESLEKILLRCKDKGVPIILSTVAVNSGDIEPNRSVLSDPENEDAVRALLDRAQVARSEGDCAAALRSYEDISSLEPGFALAHYLAGQCSREQGLLDRAREEFRQAQELDANPYRVLPTQNAMLEALAAEHEVPLVDAVAILERAAPDGIVGYNLMWDNCHPTLEGYARIARGFADRVETLFGVRSPVRDVDLEDVARHLPLTREQEFQSLIWSGQFMYRYSVMVWDPTARLARAELYLERAGRLIPGRVEYFCAEATLAAFRGDRASSLRFWREAYAADAGFVRERLENPDLRRLLKRIGFANVKGLIRELEPGS